MPACFRAVLFFAYAALCFGVPAQAQFAVSPPDGAATSPTIATPLDYTGQVRYGDTGKPAADVRVYFQVMHEGVNDNTPTFAVTTDATGTFRVSRCIYPLHRTDFISIEVNDPRSRYAAECVEVVPVSPFSREALPGIDSTFPTLTQDGLVSDDPYPNGVLHFVPQSAWRSKPSTFITLETGTFVSGTVTDATSGRPLPGIAVCAYGPHNRQSFSYVSDIRTLEAYAADPYTAVTDDAGRYRLPIMPGQCALAINHHPSYGGDDSHTVAFSAVRGKTSTANLALSPDEIAR